MNKNILTEAPGSGEKRRRQFQTTRLLPQQEHPEEEALTFCVVCLLAGFTRPATGHTSHPEYRRLALCAECVAHYERAVIEYRPR